jgi:uncharacterized membrane protein (UPF0127 family)
MVKNLLLPLAAVALFIILVGIFTQKSSSINWSKYLQGATPVQQKTVTINSKTIQVEIADTQSSREKGLSGRTSLGAESGMLFIFDTKQVSPTFWMKDMLIPLDMIWVSGDKVVKIDKDIPAPAPGTKDSALTKYTPNRAVDYVLEVNAGFASSNSIKVGDAVSISGL